MMIGMDGTVLTKDPGVVEIANEWREELIV